MFGGHGVYLDGLGFVSADVEFKAGDTSASFERRLRTVSKINAPGPIKSLLGDTVTTVEDGVFDAVTRTWTFTVRDQRMKDKLAISGKVTTTPRDDGKIDQRVEMKVKSKVPLIGGQIERFAMRESTRSWAKSAEFMNQWVADRGFAG